eukprot:1761193-Prymnesium_polylepis.1
MPSRQRSTLPLAASCLALTLAQNVDVAAFHNTGVSCERPCYTEGNKRSACASGFCGLGSCCRYGTREDGVCDGTVYAGLAHGTASSALHLR